jgi:hypothetical protein
MVHLSGCSAVSCHLTVYTKFRTPFELEGENAKLKRLLAEAHLDIHALNTAFGVKR